MFNTSHVNVKSPSSIITKTPFQSLHSPESRIHLGVKYAELELIWLIRRGYEDGSNENGFKVVIFLRLRSLHENIISF